MVRLTPPCLCCDVSALAVGWGRERDDERKMTADTITWPTGADLDPDVIYGTAPADWQPPIRITIPQSAR